MRKKAFSILLLLFALAPSGWAQSIAGDWLGTLKAGGAELRLVMHVTQADDRTWHATLDSIDQGANGIPIDSMELAGSKLHFTSSAIHGSYDGTVTGDAKKIDGTWTQGQALPLQFARLDKPLVAQHKPGKPSDIDGTWDGSLDTGMMKLRIVFHITNTEDGLTATMDSPDQGVKGMPATKVEQNGASLTIQMKSINGDFKSTISDDRSTLTGTWTQMGNSMPLVLKRSKEGASFERKRPQNPVRPFPYREENIHFENSAAKIQLAGTLTIPEGKGPFPAVVLITGSGPQDRDESLMGHKPFLVLSDYLTRHGIAVLRADDRGTAQSEGNFGNATSADFATDTEAGLRFLRSRPECDAKHLGLIGHSEGGMIGPLVAAGDPAVSFVVMMAGPGVPAVDLLTEQTRLIGLAAGKSTGELAKYCDRQRKLFALIEREPDKTRLAAQAREQLTADAPEAQIGAMIEQIGSPWFRYFLAYDPAATLKRVQCPVLAINGQKDLQVPPEQNLPPIREALRRSGSRDFEVDELPGLNHLFQTATTGAPSEYAEIEETMSPVALQKITSWILAHGR